MTQRSHPTPEAAGQGLQPAAARRLRLSWALGIATTLVALVAIAACGGRESSGAPAFQPELIGTPDAAAASKLDAAFDFEFSPYGGPGFEGLDTVRLSELQGHPLILNFWAGLCPPCRAEMPDFQEFYDEYGDKVTLLGLDVGPFTGLGSNKTGRGLVMALNIRYPTGSTEDASVVIEYGVFSMPTTVFITAEGKIFRKWSGILNKDKLIEIASDMLAASGEDLGAVRG